MKTYLADFKGVQAEGEGVLQVSPSPSFLKACHMGYIL